jgi:hypothetical protein
MSAVAKPIEKYGNVLPLSMYAALSFVGSCRISKTSGTPIKQNIKKA